jgi:hypothetical protein
MTTIAKIARSAAALAILASAATTTLAVAAQASPRISYRQKSVPNVRLKPGRHIIVVSLGCRNGSGDVVAPIVVKNTSGITLPAGKQIHWTVYYTNKSYSGTYTLPSTLLPNHYVSISNITGWNFTCKATVAI